jgi:Acetoacetate decarboxylase (ADC)
MSGSSTAGPVYRIAGQDVSMPCVVRDASAGTAMFEVDAAAAQRMVPGVGFDVVESGVGRCQLVLAAIDYRDNDLGAYHEVGVTLFVTARSGSADAGTFITRLPVDQAFTCEAGRTIWGFPKSLERIEFEYSGSSVLVTLSMDRELVLRLGLPRGGHDDMAPMDMTTFSFIDGVPHATPFTQRGSGAQVLPGSDGVSLELGDHPLAKELAALGLPAPALMSTWTERMQGVFQAPVPLDLDLNLD